MQTELNIEARNFFSEVPLDEISITTINKYFKNIKKENNYGGLLHAAIHNKYPEEKVLKFIEILLSNGLDPNLKGKETGYSFIHLALYGHSKGGSDFSYSTEFIVKLIILAKNYGLDIHITDDDQDTIIHTAIVSETYTGSIMEIVNALGPNFDYSIKNKDGRDIYQALLNCESDAMIMKNLKWEWRLRTEEKDIKRLVNTPKPNFHSFKEEADKIKEKLEELLQEINISYLLTNYKLILQIKEKVSSYSNQEESEDSTLLREIVIIYEKLDTLIKKTITDYIAEKDFQTSLAAINELLNLTDVLNYPEIKKTILEIKTNYNEQIEALRRKILSSSTLKEIKLLEKELSVYEKEKIFTELKCLFEERVKYFLSQIELNKKNLNILAAINNYLKNANPYSEEAKDYDTLTITELNSENNKLKEIIKENKNLIKKSIADKTEELLNFVFFLEDAEIFEAAELLNVINEKLSPTTPKRKMKVERKQ